MHFMLLVGIQLSAAAVSRFSIMFVTVTNEDVERSSGRCKFACACVKLTIERDP